MLHHAYRIGHCSKGEIRSIRCLLQLPDGGKQYLFLFKHVGLKFVSQSVHRLPQFRQLRVPVTVRRHDLFDHFRQTGQFFAEVCMMRLLNVVA